MLKKLLLNSILIVAVILVMDFAIGRILRYYYFQEMSGPHFSLTYAMERTEADVLVFGSSRAIDHYIPEIFEASLKMSFFSAGRENMGILYQTAVLKSVLKRYTPKIIILEFPGFETGEREYDRLSSLLPYYRTHEEIRSIIELKSPFERIKLISEIYPFNSGILLTVNGNLEINKIKKGDINSYVSDYEEWKAEIDSIPDSNAYTIDSNRVACFHEFITDAKKSGAKVFIVYSPIFLKYDKDQGIEICNRICNSEHIPFWDFSKDTLFLQNKQLFKDVLHLNHKGAFTFSNLIVEKIKRNINNNVP
jgi:hypothetical protein